MNLFRKLACAALLAGFGLPVAQLAPAAVNPGTPFTQLEPAQGERLRGNEPTRIAARLRAAGQAIAPGSVVLRVDGLNVTRHLKIQGGALEYLACLDAGSHTAELLLRDAAGHESRTAWSFEVARPYWAWPFGADDDVDDEFDWDFRGR